MTQNFQSNSSDLPKKRLYDRSGSPSPHFNESIKAWLSKQVTVQEHNPPASFEPVRQAYEIGHQAILRTIEQNNQSRWNAHKLMLSGLTELLLGIDIKPDLEARLSSASINVNGFRSAFAQGFAKNTGENFINIITYALADALAHQDEILVDKGLSRYLRPALTLKRIFRGTQGESRDLEIPIEGDLTIFSRNNPGRAIVINAKTRLKEVFHIGTMWALFFDLLDDQQSLQKWSLRRKLTISTAEMLYVFATADLIPEKGTRTQGPDIPPDKPVRNLLAADASFFDYVFVSKRGIPSVSQSLNVRQGREALFHELGCLLDLIEQQFGGVDFSSVDIPDKVSLNQPINLKIDWT